MQWYNFLNIKPLKRFRSVPDDLSKSSQADYLDILPPAGSPGLSSVPTFYHMIRHNFSRNWTVATFDLLHKPKNLNFSSKSEFQIETPNLNRIQLDYTSLMHRREHKDVSGHRALRTLEMYKIPFLCTNGQILMCLLATTTGIAVPYELLCQFSSWLEIKIRTATLHHQTALAFVLSAIQKTVVFFQNLLLLLPLCIYTPLYWLDDYFMEKDAKGAATPEFQREKRSKYLGVAMWILFPFYILMRPITEIIRLAFSSALGLFVTASATVTAYLLTHSHLAALGASHSFYFCTAVLILTWIGTLIYQARQQYLISNQQLADTELKLAVRDEINSVLNKNLLLSKRLVILWKIWCSSIKPTGLKAVQNLTLSFSQSKFKASSWWNDVYQKRIALKNRLLGLVKVFQGDNGQEKIATQCSPEELEKIKDFAKIKSSDTRLGAIWAYVDQEIFSKVSKSITNDIAKEIIDGISLTKEQGKIRLVMPAKHFGQFFQDAKAKQGIPNFLTIDPQFNTTDYALFPEQPCLTNYPLLEAPTLKIAIALLYFNYFAPDAPACDPSEHKIQQFEDQFHKFFHQFKANPSCDNAIRFCNVALNPVEDQQHWRFEAYNKLTHATTEVILELLYKQKHNANLPIQDAEQKANQELPTIDKLNGGLTQLKSILETDRNASTFMQKFDSVFLETNKDKKNALYPIADNSANRYSLLDLALINYLYIKQTRPNDNECLLTAARYVHIVLTSNNCTPEDHWFYSLSKEHPVGLMALRHVMGDKDFFAALSKARTALLPSVTQLNREQTFKEFLEYCVFQATGQQCEVQLKSNHPSQSGKLEPSKSNSSQSFGLPKVIFGLLLLSVSTITTQLLIQHTLLKSHSLALLLTPHSAAGIVALIGLGIAVIALAYLLCACADFLAPKALPTLGSKIARSSAEKLVAHERAIQVSNDPNSSTTKLHTLHVASNKPQDNLSL